MDNERGGFRFSPLAHDLELLSERRLAGLVTEASVNRLLPRSACRRPEHLAVTQGGISLTHGELSERVARVAGFLRARGIGPGSVVSWQAPNWWESAVFALATWQVGAVSNPIVTIYREKELRHIVAELRPDAVICAASVGSQRPTELLDTVLAETGVKPAVKIALRGDAASWTSSDEVFMHAADPRLGRLSPDDPCLVLYTSGTTAAPKGAVHTSRSLLAETRQVRDEWGIGWDDTAYMPAPLPHITGVLIGITLPLLSGSHCVLSDGWDAERAVGEIHDNAVTYSAGATVFLQELAAATEERSDLPPATWRIYACGGAPVPRSVMEHAEAVGIPAIRVYGMTELPTVTLGHAGLPFERRAETDGRVAEGVEVRVVDDDGRPARPGQAGELLVRGPELFAGYVDPGTTNAVLDGGWFRTGDIGSLGEHDDITITGRIKDIINRGGEKFSTREIEDLLVRHPDVRQAAVIPAPHARLGEVPAAFLVVDAELDPQTLITHLANAGLAKQKHPVLWHALDRLPTTPSGKVRKNELSTLLNASDRETRSRPGR